MKKYSILIAFAGSLFLASAAFAQDLVVEDDSGIHSFPLKDGSAVQIHPLTGDVIVSLAEPLSDTMGGGGANAAVITSFTVDGKDSTSIEQGGSVKFAWATETGAKAAKVCHSTGNLSGWSNVNRNPSGTITVSISASPGTYQAGLECYNLDGGDAKARTVEVLESTSECGASPPATGTQDTNILVESTTTVTTSFASVLGDFPGDNLSRSFRIRSDRYAALSFNSGSLPSGAGGRIALNDSTLVNVGTIAMSISQCPGDLGPQPDARCRALRYPTSIPRIFYWRINEPDSGNDSNTSSNRCPLLANTNYYLNMMPATTLPADSSPGWDCDASNFSCGALITARRWD